MKSFLLGYAVLTAAGTLIAMATGMEGPIASFLNLGTAGVLVWYLYYDVALARPARHKASVDADAARDSHVERLVTQLTNEHHDILAEIREDAARQHAIVAEHYEHRLNTYREQIKTLEKALLIDRGQPDDHRDDTPNAS